MHLYTSLKSHTGQFFAIVIIALLLTGCPSIITTDVNDYLADKSSSYYMNKMQNSLGIEKTDWQLLTIRALLREGNTEKARELLQKLPNSFTEYQKQEVLLTVAEFQLAKNNPSSALNNLNQIKLAQLNTYQVIRYKLLQVQLMPKTDPLVKLRAYIELEKEITQPYQHQLVSNGVWDVLTSIPIDKVSNLTINADEDILRGWLDLIILYNDNHHDLKLLEDSIKNWQNRYPNNPLAITLPKQLTSLLTFKTTTFSRIALLLPMSENTLAFSKAIQQGVMTAIKQDNAPVEVDVIDTSNQSINDIMTQLDNQRTTLVIGPLLKNDVDAISQTPSSINILALNTPEYPHIKSNICYFGLSPEDEARDAARMIMKTGQQTPLLLIPYNNLGDRVALAFNDTWTKLGGQTTLVQRFGSYEELSNLVNHGKNIVIGGEPLIAGEPQPTTPIDSIYILANTRELTLIKTMLDMKVTSRSKAELYASSRSNQANSSPDFRLDMEGLKFSEIPLLAGGNKQLLEQAMGDFKNDYTKIRLFALGLDAWNVAKSMSEIRQLPDFTIKGATGTLTSNNSCIINRQLVWLQFKQGRLNVIE